MPDPASVALTIPDDVRARVEQAALTVLDEAKALSVSITNDTQLAAAADFRKNVVKVALAKLDADFQPVIKRWYDGHRNEIARHRKWAAPFNRALEMIDTAIKQYGESVLRKQLEDAERIRQSLQEAAEQSAIERAAEMVSSGNEQEQAEGAAMLESVAQGSVTPSTTLPAMIPVKPKVAGLSLRTLKRFRIIDASKVHRDFTAPDESKIQAIVSEYGKEAEEIVGGIEVYEITSVASR